MCCHCAAKVGQEHCNCCRFQKNPGFSNPLVLGFYWVLGFIGFFGLFYLNEPLESVLVDLAHRLSFYFRLSTNLQIRYLLVVRSCKHKEIFNYY